MELLSNCPICNNAVFSFYLECKDYTVSHETFKLVQCDECCFVFTNPRPTKEEINKYYLSEDYISHSNNTKGFFNFVYQKVRKYAIRRKISLIDKLKVRNKTALDYGCGTGQFLNALKVRSWDVTGIEPSVEVRKDATSTYNLNIYDPSYLVELKNEQFGLITLWHVLEHVHNLNSTFSHFNRILNAKGNLIIAVPNRESWDAKYYSEFWAAYDVPRHLYHFSIKNIKQLAFANNFHVKKIIPMPFDPFYISLLSEKYKSPKTNYFHALLSGIKTSIWGMKDIKNNSSLIYILEKK